MTTDSASTASRYLQQAISAHQSGALTRAERLYRKHLASQPEDFHAQQLLGALFLGQNRLLPACKLLQSSIRLEPMQPHTQANLGECLRRLGRPQEALFHLAEAVKQDATNLAALRNGTLAAFQVADIDKAAFFIETGLAVSPDDIGLRTLLGQLHQERGEYDQSIEVLRQVLREQPGRLPALHNLGVSLRLNNQPARAIECYNQVVQAAPDNYAVLQNLGNAETDLGRNESAMTRFERVIALAPDYTPAYDNLADLRWRTRHDRPLAAFEARRKAGGLPPDLGLSYGAWLLKLERREELQALLADEGLAEHPRALDLLGRSALGRGDFPAAVDLHRRATAAGGEAALQLNLGVALLNAGDPAGAEAELRRVLEREPESQLALAWLGVCWRLQGDEREAALNDHAALVQEEFLPVPDGFGSLDEFNEQLAGRLRVLHTSRQYPLRQTLRGGTQTQGNLFALEDALLAHLMDAFREAVSGYLARDQMRLQRETLWAFGDRFEFSGAWSVQLEQGGFHIDHVHPMGRISSAYYVRLPALGDETARDGWLRFGVPQLQADLGLDTQAVVKPEPGKLVLFPSYFWHGTLPFHTPDERLTVAFDVAPLGSRRVRG